MIKEIPQSQFQGRSLGDRRLDIWAAALGTATTVHGRLFHRPSMEEITVIYNKLCETFGVTEANRGRDSDKARPPKRF